MRRGSEDNRVKELHPDIEFVTDNGTKVILRWMKNEYRAFKNKNQDMFLGALTPGYLIEYIKKRF